MSIGHSDADWEADMDLDTLVEAGEISKDPSRVARAKTRASVKAAELREQAEGLADEKSDERLASEALQQGFMRLPG